MTVLSDHMRLLADWWLDRTRNALPPWLTGAREPALYRWTGEALVGASVLPRRGASWCLWLPEARVLTLRRTLPLSALSHLRRVVALQLGQWSPLTADTALFAVTVEGTGADGLHLRIDLLPRSVLEPALAAAGKLGTPRTVRVGDGIDLPMAEAEGRRLPPRLTLAALLLLALPLTAAILNEGELARLRLEVEAGEAEQAQLRSLGHRIARQRADILAAVTARREAPSLLLMLDRLSRLLPDDSHLTGLRVEGGRVHLEGYAADGAALLSLLDASPQFEDARFEAALLRAGPRGDRFHLSVKVSADAPA